MSPQIYHRTLAIVATDADLLSFSFSSEAAVQRSFGTEVLSHDPGACDLSRLNDGAPLLWNHDPGQLLGVIETARIINGKGRATARWGSSPEAQQRRADVEAGVLRNVSVGYTINDMKQRGDQWLVTSWQPLEISLVSIAADASVGIGRSLQTEPTQPDIQMTEDIEQTSELETLARQLRSIEARLPQQQPIASASDSWGAAELPLTAKEQRSYSVIKAMQAAATGDWSKAGFERECSRALEQQTGRSAQGFMFPANLPIQQRTAYITSTAAAAGDLVATDLLADSFIESLRKRLLVMQLGATMLPGLVGNVDIPRRTGSASTYWVAEGSAVTESNGTFDLVSLRPKTVGALSSWTRIMQLQSTPALEELVRSDMVQQVATAIDLAAITGTGANNQPTGILNTTGIGSVAGGTNGAAISLNHLADLKREVAIDDADLPSCAYLTNAKVEAALSKLATTAGAFILQPDGPTGDSPARLFGRRFAVSNQVPSNLTKGSASGTCSAVLYGSFTDLLVGMWGATDVLVNPYGANYAAGNVEVRVMQTVDIAVRHPESFAAMKDALT